MSKIRRGGEVIEDERKEPWVEKAARWTPVYIAVLITFIGLLVLINVKSDHQQSRDIQQANYRAAYDNRLASYEACKRGNDSRAGTIATTLDIAQGNEDRAAAWASLSDQQLPPEILAFALEERSANLAEARRLRADVDEIVAAQHQVAKHPLAADPIKRSKVDCSEQYPLPERYGDPLPTVA